MADLAVTTSRTSPGHIRPPTDEAAAALQGARAAGVCGESVRTAGPAEWRCQLGSTVPGGGRPAWPSWPRNPAAANVCGPHSGWCCQAEGPERRSSCSVHGDDGMGFVVATRAMDEAIQIARDQGVGLAGVRRSTHFGCSSHYVMQALEADMLSFVFTNSSPALPPFGGARALLGASPFAAGVPGTQPVVLDMCHGRKRRREE
ncbi:unnamed protein product, partial [Effrenium voratum]